MKPDVLYAGTTPLWRGLCNGGLYGSRRVEDRVLLSSTPTNKYGRELISCKFLKIIFNSKTKRTIRASFSLFSLFFFRRDWEGVAPGDLIDPRRSLPTSSLSSAFLLRSGGRAPPSLRVLEFLGKIQFLAASRARACDITVTRFKNFYSGINNTTKYL